MIDALVSIWVDASGWGREDFGYEIRTTLFLFCCRYAEEAVLRASFVRRDCS